MKSARQEILEKLKKTTVRIPEMPDFESPVFHEQDGTPELVFKKNLMAVNGNVSIFESEQELFRQLKGVLATQNQEKICCAEPEIQTKLNKSGVQISGCSEIPDNIEISITGCEFLVAQTGSVLVSSAQKGGRKVFIFPPQHFVVASKKQIVNSLGEAYSAISEKYGNDLPSQLLLITGPSRTADIEKTLTLGAHGPKGLHVFLY
ncbi:MAG: LutC/YkgG family protein [Bacteroidota bacterium]